MLVGSVTTWYTGVRDGEHVRFIEAKLKTVLSQGKKIRKTIDYTATQGKKDCELKPIIKTMVLVNVGFGLCGDEVNYIFSILQLLVS